MASFCTAYSLTTGSLYLISNSSIISIGSVYDSHIISNCLALSIAIGLHQKVDFKNLDNNLYLSQQYSRQSHNKLFSADVKSVNWSFCSILFIISISLIIPLDLSVILLLLELLLVFVLALSYLGSRDGATTRFINIDSVIDRFILKTGSCRNDCQ